MFDLEIKRILDYVGQGISVRVIGAVGSGRTTVARRVVVELEDQGVKVLSISAMPSLANAPFAGIISLGLDLRSKPSGILGVADLVTAELARPGSRVFVIDDVENLDRESLSVIDIVQKRTLCPLITTMSDKSLQSGPALTLAPWPEASVELQPLRFEQINSLITQIRGAPADVDVVARILTKSGGNLRLVTRILHSAVLSKRLILLDGRWRMNGETLLNEHLRSTVEAMLHGLDREELRALEIMAMFGAHPLDAPRRTIDATILDVLERRGLVSVVTGSDGLLRASVFPPLLADYLRSQVLGSRRVLSGTIAPNIAVHSLEPSQSSMTDGRFADAVAALKQSNFNNAAAARHFHEQVRDLERHHYEIWTADKSVSNAAAFLRVYWGAPIDPPRIEEVFRHTDTSRSDHADLLFFAMTRALWTVLSQDDLTQAKKLMLELTESEPCWAAEAEAFAIFLEASYNKMPEDLDDAFARLTSRNPTSGVIAAVRGLLELYRFNPEGALEVIDAAEGFESLPRFEPFIRGLALFASGQVDEALIYALERREEALRAVDQFSLVANTYVAALALIYRGLFEEAEYLMGWTFSVRKPGFLVNSLHNAMLRLSSLRNGSNDPSLAMQAGADTPDVGPLPATGKGVFDLVANPPMSAEAFDEAATRLIDENLDHGFVLEAVYAALFALCLLPGPEVRSRLKGLLEARGATHHGQLLAVADALIDNDPQLLNVLVDNYEPDGDLYQVAMILRGAAVRSRLKGEAISSAAIERAAKRFAAKHSHITQYMHFDPESPISDLTVREIEIARLAGDETNQEIAAKLGLSVRTVESHVSNALRKTQTTSRNALFELVRYAVDQSRSSPDQ